MPLTTKPSLELLSARGSTGVFKGVAGAKHDEGVKGVNQGQPITTEGVLARTRQGEQLIVGKRVVHVSEADNTHETQDELINQFRRVVWTGGSIWRDQQRVGS